MDMASHPLVSTMQRSAEINQFFSLPVREPEQEGWIEATDLFLGDDQRLRDLIMTYGQKSWGTTNNHVAGSFHLRSHTQSDHALNSDEAGMVELARLESVITLGGTPKMELAVNAVDQAWHWHEKGEPHL